MRITLQLALMPLTIISSLAFTAHGIPHKQSVTDTAVLFGRDDTANYVVYPKDTKNEAQATAIYTLLKSMVSDPTTIFNSTTDNGNQHWFWGVPLTSANAEKLKGDSNIAAVVQECTSNCAGPTENDETLSFKSRRSDDRTNYTEESRLVKRNGQIVNAHHVDDDVAFISLPPNRPLGKDFVYDNTAGTGQTIYIIDTGAWLGNTDEFSRYVAPNARYLQARGARANDGLENDSSNINHGTSVLAKAVGWKHGVAKRSKPVIVRIAAAPDPGAWLNGVQQVYNDWLLTYNANVCIGLLPIVASGNGPFNPPVESYPQLFAYPSNGKPAAVPNMLLVGGVTVPDGNIWYRSRVDPPGTNPRVMTLYAPSFNIVVPHPRGGWGRTQGVSFAAGTISGLGTYFLGLSSLSPIIVDDDPVRRVIRLKQVLERGSSVARGIDRNVKSLWNLVDPEKCPPGTPPPGFQDGDEVPCGGTAIAIPDVVIS